MRLNDLNNYFTKLDEFFKDDGLLSRHYEKHVGEKEVINGFESKFSSKQFPTKDKYDIKADKLMNKKATASDPSSSSEILGFVRYDKRKYDQQDYARVKFNRSTNELTIYMVMENGQKYNKTYFPATINNYRALYKTQYYCDIPEDMGGKMIYSVTDRSDSNVDDNYMNNLSYKDYKEDERKAKEEKKLAKKKNKNLN